MQRTHDGLYVASQSPMSGRGISPYFRIVIPEILNDGQRLLQLWGRAGSLDPFEKISEVSHPLYVVPDITYQKRIPVPVMPTSSGQ